MGFNGMEKDDEVKGTGNSLDFGARMYDSRLGRWMSLDPLAAKYPALSPYNFVANSPIVLIDPDGRDYGVKINHTNKTVVFVMNVYTLKGNIGNQAKEGAEVWNNTKYNIDGYKISFEINVMPPINAATEEQVVKNYSKINFYSSNGKINKKVLEKNQIRLTEDFVRMAAADDPRGIGNSYVGTSSRFSISYPIELASKSGSHLGANMAHTHTYMNSATDGTDFGDDAFNVGHEFGHSMGLNDKGKGRFFSFGGIMEYQPIGMLKKPSIEDVQNIIDFTNFRFEIGNPPGNSSDGMTKVYLLEEIGNAQEKATSPIKTK